jgi:hypothetical protein
MNKKITDLKSVSQKSTMVKSHYNKTDASNDVASLKSATAKPLRKRGSVQEGKPRIPRNVNFYRHLINAKAINENDIEWVLKLRTPAERSQEHKFEATVTQPFSLFGKELEGQQLKRTTSELGIRNRLHELPHLYLKRLGPTPGQSTVQFESGLRDYGFSTERLQSLEKNWKNIPKKDRNEPPKMYPSYAETLHIKNWTTKNLLIETHSGFDGCQNYPKYGELTGKLPKNVCGIKHLLSSPGQTMSTLDWQLSMRNYGSTSKSKIEGENETEERLLGELKKVNRRPKRL